ncbi:uncharacterized protein LOC126576738 [Anopheles aquasalis]|uniref:uncharacterized protein LOC126576738 n=1 Tax=Anopheles aquasalis TaxID=42839 RepID=UPI00215B3CDE|nr:uncharacterized protein LOC126576738 [Anopheles aquasalis]
MASTRSVPFPGRLWLRLCVKSLLFSSVLCSAFFYPQDAYKTQYYYNNAIPVQSDTRPQQYPVASGYGTGYQDSPAPVYPYTGTGEGYNQNVNYYGVPGYDDYQYQGHNRYASSDSYARQYWNEYYRRKYYNAGGSRRRQDTIQETTTAAITTTPMLRSVPRKKKLFVPNVWG